MRYQIAACLIMGGSQIVSAAPSRAQQPTVAMHRSSDRASENVLTRRVTVHMNRVSLVRAIDSVSRIAKVFIEYQSPMLQAYTSPITIDVKDASLGVVLEQLLSGTALHAMAEDQGSVAIVATSAVGKDSVPGLGTISGRVVDSANGRGLGQATIKVQGTKLSAISGDSGRFIIRDVPVGTQVLTTRVFGHRPMTQDVTVTTNETVTLRIMMASVPNVLNGVVTTAVGVQRKIEVGNDITTLNVDSIRQTAPISSVTDLLENRVPGLTVVHSSGVPGDPSRLRLRGAGSIERNNDPIVIVDGIRVYAQQSDPRNQNLAAPSFNAPSPIDQIDPSSIETIDVLKGPSASAIYGSDAAGGVIVITTKKGRAGPTTWTADLGTGINWLPGQWPTNYYQFGHNIRGVGPLCPWFDVTCKVDSTVAFQALNDPRYTVFSHGTDQQANLSVQGGVSAITYSVTGSMQSTLGNLKLPGSEVQLYDSLYGAIPHSLVRPDLYNTWGVTGSLTAAPRPTLTVTLMSSINNQTQRQSSLQSAITQLAGEYLSPALQVGPLLAGEYQRVTEDRTTANNSISLQWRPRPWLPLEATAGVNSMQRNAVSYIPYGVYYGGYELDNGQRGAPADTTGSYGLGRGNSQVKTLTVGTHDVPLFRNKILLAFGGNFTSMSTADFNVATDQLAPGITDPTTFTELCNDGSAGCYSPTMQSTYSQSTYGWYMQPTLNLNSRFFASPGFRLDGGSGGTHGSSLGGLTGFPKIDFSYVAVDRQDQRPLWGVISLLRPRLAFGYAGAQPAPADKLRLYNIGSAFSIPVLGTQGSGGITGASGGCSPVVTIDGITESPAVCLNAVGNTVLRPERSSELEGGFDATLWQNRLSLTVSAYNKTRHDAILDIPVAPSVIATNLDLLRVQKNIGVIRNTGTEVTADATPIDRAMFRWSVQADFSKNTNQVVRLNPGQGPIVLSYNTNGANVGSQVRVQPGFPLYGVFVRPIAGYADVNGDGILEPSEVQYGDSLVFAGQPDPNYELSVSQDVALLSGKLSLHALIAYQNGMTQFNQGACGNYNSPFNLLPNRPNTPLATQAAVVAAGCTSDAAYRGVSTIGLIQTVNTLRFQSLSVNYVLPRRTAQWFRVPRMSLALQGNNLGLHTNYRGKDPEVNAFATVSKGDQTVDSGQIPLPRTWLLKLTLGN